MVRNGNGLGLSLFSFIVFFDDTFWYSIILLLLFLFFFIFFFNFGRFNYFKVLDLLSRNDIRFRLILCDNSFDVRDFITDFNLVFLFFL